MAMRAFYALVPPPPGRDPGFESRDTERPGSADGEPRSDAIEVRPEPTHSQPTPLWDLRPPIEPALWLLISNDVELFQRAWRAAPSRTDVLLVSSISVLDATLTRSHRITVVLDAGDPSVPLETAIDLLAHAPYDVHVVLWRTDAEARELLRELPETERWLAFEGINAREMVQLVTLGV
jgi:hypothetical protein